MKKKLYEKNARYGLLIVLIFYAVLHLFTREKLLDDRTFQELFNQYTAWDYLAMRYETWTSRVIIEAVFLLITRFPFIIWQICDTLMYVAIYWCFQQTFEIKGKANICLALSICCYIFLQMASAGWIITSITYTWTIATCFLCLVILKQYMQGQKLSIFHFLMYILCTLYTCNYEIMAIAMLLIYLTLLIRQLIHRKKRLGLLYVGIALQALSTLFIFTAPGNFLRVQQANSLYNQLSLFGKIRLGIVSTYEHFVSFPNAIFGVLCLIIMLISWEQRLNIQRKVIAAIPLLIDALLSVYYVVKDIIINSKRNYVFANPEIIPESTGEWIRQMVLILLFFLTVVSILYTIWNIVAEQKEFWILFLTLAVGTATRMAMCFTNSLFESGTRTFIELYFAFIIVIAVLYKYITDKKHQILIHICLIGGMGINCILTIIPYLQNYQ